MEISRHRSQPAAHWVNKSVDPEISSVNTCASEGLSELSFVNGRCVRAHQLAAPCAEGSTISEQIKMV